LKVFDQYAAYYDLLDTDKDYSGESEYVIQKIKKHSARTESILNLGCGTGKHDFYWAKKGFEVTGADVSEKMLEEAQAEKQRSGVENINFIQRDIRDFDLNKKFDVITSLFHVMSYQNTNEEVVNVLKNVEKHLENGGVFIFDFWYGPAVLNERPEVRAKRMMNDTIKITRIAEPEVNYSCNIVTVNYDVFIEDKKSGNLFELKENHKMRYFFDLEIKEFLNNNGLTVLETEEWMTGRELGKNTWSALYVVRKSN
jgi:SAM-dependent methyltransferase